MAFSRIIGCLLIMVLLGACGGPRQPFVHPERSASQEQQDYQQCLFEAQKATGNLVDDSDREDRIEEMVDSCMHAKGYSK